MPEFRKNGFRIRYRKNISHQAKRPKIRFSRNKGFMLTVPYKIADKFRPKKFLENNIGWLKQKKKEYDHYRENTPERDFRDGSNLFLMGEKYCIKLGKFKGHLIKDNHIRISERYIDTEEDIRKTVEKLLREKARDVFKDKLEKFTEDLGVDYNRIFIRDQKTKWGSCSGKKNINLNWRLILGPEKIVDYVVAHEAVHLKIPDHNKKFWNQLEKIIPDYKKRKKWLKEKSYLLEF